MFIIKARHSEQIVIKAKLESVREFFGNMRNFIEMMPNVGSISTDLRGITRWKIRAEIPFLGTINDTFAVELTEKNEARIAYSPASIEKRNFMAYSADFEVLGENETRVKLTQSIELRRASAMDLHLLAPLAGEALISREMQKRIAEPVKNFLQKAQANLEK